MFASGRRADASVADMGDVSCRGNGSGSRSPGRPRGSPRKPFPKLSDGRAGLRRLPGAAAGCGVRPAGHPGEDRAGPDRAANREAGHRLPDFSAVARPGRGAEGAQGPYPVVRGKSRIVNAKARARTGGCAVGGSRSAGAGRWAWRKQGRKPAGISGSRPSPLRARRLRARPSWRPCSGSSVASRSNNQPLRRAHGRRETGPRTAPRSHRRHGRRADSDARPRAHAPPPAVGTR